MARLLVVFIVLIPNLALADGFYLGLKAGQVKVNGAPVDTKSGFGGQMGYQFTSSFALQADLLLGKGEVLDLNVALDTFSIYGVYRSTGRYYLLAYLGAAAKQVEVENFDNLGKRNTRWSGGFGFGFHPYPEQRLELEYTRLDADLDYLGINFNYSF